MWADWQKFQAAAARKRREAKEEAAREARRRKEQLEDMVEYIAIGMAVIVLAGLLVGGIVLYLNHIR
jgi:cell division septal protein FtsQ